MIYETSSVFLALEGGLVWAKICIVFLVFYLKTGVLSWKDEGSSVFFSVLGHGLQLKYFFLDFWVLRDEMETCVFLFLVWYRQSATLGDLVQPQIGMLAV